MWYFAFQSLAVIGIALMVGVVAGWLLFGGAGAREHEVALLRLEVDRLRRDRHELRRRLALHGDVHVGWRPTSSGEPELVIDLTRAPEPVPGSH